MAKTVHIETTIPSAPNKVEHIMVINRRVGLVSPLIISPEGLWVEEES